MSAACIRATAIASVSASPCDSDVPEHDGVSKHVAHSRSAPDEPCAFAESRSSAGSWPVRGLPPPSSIVRRSTPRARLPPQASDPSACQLRTRPRTGPQRRWCPPPRPASLAGSDRSRPLPAGTRPARPTSPTRREGRRAPERSEPPPRGPPSASAAAAFMNATSTCGRTSDSSGRATNGNSISREVVAPRRLASRSNGPNGSPSSAIEWTHRVPTRSDRSKPSQSPPNAGGRELDEAAIPRGDRERERPEGRCVHSGGRTAYRPLARGARRARSRSRVIPDQRDDAGEIPSDATATAALPIIPPEKSPTGSTQSFSSALGGGRSTRRNRPRGLRRRGTSASRRPGRRATHQ